MPFVNSQIGGFDWTPLDICLTPPLGTPDAYNNIALGPTAIPVVDVVAVAGGILHNLLTIIPISLLDEGGSYGGIISGTTNGLAMHITCSVIFIAGGAPVTRTFDLAVMNSFNTVGLRLLPSQYIVLAPF